jgi:hypothetical protein
MLELSEWLCRKEEYCSVSSYEILFFLKTYQISRYSPRILPSTFPSTIAVRNERVCHCSLASCEVHSSKIRNVISNSIQIYNNLFRPIFSDNNSCRKQMKLSYPLFLHIFTSFDRHRADYPSEIYTFSFL